MIRISLPILLVASFANATAAPVEAQTSTATPPTMQSIAFMTGCWQESDQGGLREQFSPTASNRMTGLSQYWRGDAIVDWEFHRIDLSPAGPVLTPHPKGVASVSFEPAAIEPGRVVWSNPDHDFPNRIIYHRVAPDTLVARVEGDATDAPVLEFRMAQVSCVER